MSKCRKLSAEFKRDAIEPVGLLGASRAQVGRRQHRAEDRQRQALPVHCAGLLDERGRPWLFRPARTRLRHDVPDTRCGKGRCVRIHRAAPQPENAAKECQAGFAVVDPCTTVRDFGVGRGMAVARIKRQHWAAWLLGRRITAWLRRVPAAEPVDRRNAPALQVLLIFLGLEIPLNKVYHLLTYHIHMSPSQLAVDVGTDAAMTVAAWGGVWMIRRGLVKHGTALFIGVTLFCALLANLAFGYQLQVFDPYPMMLLTLAALVIGRQALWCVYACIPVMFLLGMGSPWAQPPQDHGSRFQNLPSLALSYLVITLVLDRTVAVLRESLALSRKSAVRLKTEMRERELVQARLLHMQKIETVGQLASGISHDFNNILGSIIGHASIRFRVFELDFDPQAEALQLAEALEGVEAAAQRGITITRKILSFSRQELLTPVVFNVVDAINELAPMLRQLLGRDVILKLELGGRLLNVRLDRSQFELVLLNFAANARDAMVDGGFFSVASFLDGDEVLIQLADSGIGMSPEVARQSFEPFYTTKQNGQGTGLGLAVALDMARMAKGSLSVESAVGVGSCFSLRLPLASADIPGRESNAVEEPCLFAAKPSGGGDAATHPADEGQFRSPIFRPE